METIRLAREAKQLKNETGKDTPLTHEMILDNIYSPMTEDNCGRYRSPWFFPIVGLKGVDWLIPGGHKVDGLMDELLDWYNNHSQDLHPIERAARLHNEFVRIHPLADGNGRIARLLLNYELVKNGYPTITIKATQRKEYVDAINESIMTGDITKMVDLITRRMHSRLNLYDSIIRSADNENNLINQ